MNTLLPEIQNALAECRKEMSASLCREQALKEENDELKELLISQREDAAMIAIELTKNSEIWRQECLQLQSSLSWRLTKPLRLLKKVVHSLDINGLKLTLLKIKNWRK